MHRVQADKKLDKKFHRRLDRIMMKKLTTTGLALTLGFGLATTAVGNVSAEEGESTNVDATTDVGTVVNTEDGNVKAGADLDLGLSLDEGLDLDSVLEDESDNEAQEDDEGLLGGLL